jgi:hypothetical protein
LLLLADAHPRTAAGALGVAHAVNEDLSVAAAGEFVAVAWAATPVNRPTAIYVAVSRDAGRSFGEPVRVATDANVGGEQPPRVVLAPATSRPGGPASFDIVVVWPQKSRSGTRLLTSRSRDGGRSFDAPVLVRGTAATGNRGWHSIAVNAAGHPVVTWLDHRDAAAAMPGAEHHHGVPDGDGSAAEQSAARAAASRLYVGSTDGGVPVQGLVHSVCYCCKTALATAPNGDLMLAWRHVYAGGYRDMAFSRSSDGGRTFSTPVRVSQDGWQLAGCPEDGPALAIDHRGTSHVVWPTLVRENGRETMGLFHAMSADGRTFSPRVRIPTHDSAFHPQLVVTTGGDLIVAWDEGSSGTRRIGMARAALDGSGGVRFRSVDTVHAGDHPALATVPDGVLIGWAVRSGSASIIRIERQPLP